MDKIKALAALSALSQGTRLDVFRLLVQAGPAGLCAGDIGERLVVRQNTMSSHLGVLARAGLIRSQREGRSIRYAADLDGMRGLLAYLLQDCCGGRPAACEPLLRELICA